MRNNFFDIFWIHELSRAHFASDRLLRVVSVNADDGFRAGEFRALDDIETDASEAKDNHRASRFNLRRKQCRTESRCRATTDVTNSIERCVLANFRDCVDW